MPVMRSWFVPAVAVVAASAVALLTGCPSSDKKPKPDPSPSATSSNAANANAPHAGGDPVKGKALVEQQQCNRCHEGTGFAAAPQGKHCVQCHTDIMNDKFGSAESRAKWQPRVKDIQDAPSLEASQKRFKRSFVESYLLLPVDQRPALVQSMPRLALTREQAKDIAAYLGADDKDDPKPTGDVAKGRQLLDTKGCGTCHKMTGVSALAASPVPLAIDAKENARAVRLAPDLRHVRDKMTAARATAWLADPKGVKPDSAMPKIPLTDAEIKDVVAYLYNAQIEPAKVIAPPDRLPVLTRKVTFEEVDKKVFHRTCWHCHSEPDYAIGDGGPGNSGGLGFKPRGLNLSDYAGIAAGFLNDKNERESIFAKDAAGVPRLVRALVARHAEEGGAPTGEVRGMPLGYAPLSLEDIQLVESWIAQGRPRT